MLWTVETDTDIRFFFSKGTRATGALLGMLQGDCDDPLRRFGRIFEIDLFDVRFEAILPKSRPIGID